MIKPEVLRKINQDIESISFLIDTLSSSNPEAVDFEVIKSELLRQLVTSRDKIDEISKYLKKRIK